MENGLLQLGVDWCRYYLYWCCLFVQYGCWYLKLYNLFFNKCAKSCYFFFKLQAQLCTYQSIGCPKILFPLLHDIIAPIGSGLSNWDISHIKNDMCGLEISSERTLKMLRNWSYCQTKFRNHNLKNTKVWRLGADWKVQSGMTFADMQ